jgi:hypothetical protein
MTKAEIAARRLAREFPRATSTCVTEVAAVQRGALVKTWYAHVDNDCQMGSTLEEAMQSVRVVARRREAEAAAAALTGKETT